MLLFKIIIIILLNCKIACRVRYIHLRSQFPHGKLVNKDFFEQPSILSRNSMFMARDSHVLFNGTNAGKLS